MFLKNIIYFVKLIVVKIVKLIFCKILYISYTFSASGEASKALNLKPFNRMKATEKTKPLFPFQSFVYTPLGKINTASEIIKKRLWYGQAWPFLWIKSFFWTVGYAFLREKFWDLFLFSISFVENAFLFPTWLCSEVTTGIYKESHMKFPQEAVVGELNKSQQRDVPFV